MKTNAPFVCIGLMCGGGWRCVVSVFQVKANPARYNKITPPLEEPHPASLSDGVGGGVGHALGGGCRCFCKHRESCRENAD